MSKSKAKLFSQEEIQVADIAKALSHPARVKILSILACTSACMCGDIVELLPLSQSTVSQHLKELKRIGLIDGEIEGPKICYCINPKVMEQAKEAFNKLFSNICECQSNKGVTNECQK